MPNGVGAGDVGGGVAGGAGELDDVDIDRRLRDAGFANRLPLDNARRRGGVLLYDMGQLMGEQPPARFRSGSIPREPKTMSRPSVKARAFSDAAD